MTIIARWTSFTADGSPLEGRVLAHGRGLPSIIAWTGNKADAEGIAAALNQHAGAVRAMGAVRDYAGSVCDTYETCEHPACRSSYSAWAIADRYLREGR